MSVHYGAYGSDPQLGPFFGGISTNFNPVANQWQLNNSVAVDMRSVNNTSNGYVTNATIAAVVDVLKGWRFESRGGQGSELKIEFIFSLSGDDAEKCLNYRVSGTIPTHFEIETNPSRNAYPSKDG